MSAITPSFLLLPFLLAVPPAGWLGVFLDGPEPVVSEVVAGSPAEKAGIRIGDRITAVDNDRITTRDRLVEVLRAKSEGAKVRLTLQRGTESRTVEVVLGKLPDEMPPRATIEPQPAAKPKPIPEPKPEPAPKVRVGQAGGQPFLGIELLEEDGRIRVVRIVPKGPADKAGLAAGQTIAEIAGKPIGKLEDLDSILQRLEVGAKIVVGVREAGATKSLELVVGAKPTAAPADPAKPQPEPAKPKPDPAPKPEQAPRPPTPPGPGGPTRRPTPPSAAAESAPAAAIRFGADYEAAIEASRRQSKPLLLVFGASWCASCQALKKSFDDPAVRAAAAGFVPVWLDTDKEGRIADQYGVQTIPLIVVQGSDRKSLARVEGYQPPASVAEMLAKIPKPATPSAAGPTSRPSTARQPVRPPAATPTPAVAPAADTTTQEIARLRAEIATMKAELETLRKQIDELGKTGGRGR